MRKTKKRLLLSVISLILCFAMLLGSTYAWFTDTVTSSDNIIQTGNFDIEMYWSDTLLPTDSTEWQPVEENAIFTHDKWEPGYTDVKYVKISNLGNLALQWKLNISADGEMTELADVIDVYYVNPVSTALASVDGLTTEGVLSHVVNNKVTTSGVLLPTGEADPNYVTGDTVIAIALHMQEDAGNSYKNMSAIDGAGFTVNLLATQFSYEADGFNNTEYDKDAEWPNNVIIADNMASANVTSQNGLVASALSLVSEDGVISANIPAGVKLENGANKVTLAVSKVSDSKANVTLDTTEASLSIDVHVHGVADDNDVVMAIGVKELLPVGLNMGNYRFYHVENSQTVEMVLFTDGATPVHNNFEYDPATGDVVLYLKSFSEVALVADTEKVWEGNIATGFAGGDGSEGNPYIIANADQLAYLGEVISNDNEAFGNKHYKLVSDINLGGEENVNKGIVFYPIGYTKVGGEIATVDVDGAPERILFDEDPDYARFSVSTLAVDSTSKWYTYGGAFRGTFDGNGNTISNIYQNTWQMKGDYEGANHYWDAAMGIFGYVYEGTVKNLTVDNFSSDGEFTPTGVVAAYAANATFENISITNCNPRVYNTGNGGIVGVGGSSSDTAEKILTFKNITVDQTNKISALWGSWDVACGGIMGMFRGNGLVNFDNCHIAAQIDVNNDVCANYQYYWYRYSGMLIGSIRKNTTEGNYTVADTTGITAANCTYTLGDWNEYWYCELVKNSLASYTHDHQFSRLTKIASLSEIQDEFGNWNREGNFVIPNADNTAATCYHIFKNSNGELYQHFHDVADESNPNIYESFDLDGNGKLDDLKEDRQCYFMPFNQVFSGNGYGVKPTYAITGLIVREDGLVKSEVKFEALETLPAYRPGKTIKLGDLVKSIVDDSKLSKISIYAAVSPATENDNVSATYVLDLADWKNSTITFSEDSHGSAKIVITDYFYCTATVIYLDLEQAAPKFDFKSVSVQNAYTSISLGDLFSTIKNNIGDVTAIFTDPDGNTITVTGTASDWATKTVNLTKSGTWKVAIKDDDSYCEVTEGEFTVQNVDKFESKFKGDFLYRVGNKNTVALGTLFSEIQTPVSLSAVSVKIENVAGTATGTYTSNATWTSGNIQFTGTGVVKVTISADGANSVELTLEVVDATNITSATGTTTGGNFVLLCDVNTTTYVNYWNCTLYGNGFTYSLEGAPTSYNSKQGHGILITKNATLDNLVIVGDVYNSYGAYTNQDYYNAAVDVVGDTVIQNCYISGCAAPVKARSNVTIKNSTLYGGTVANLLIMSGTATLENVTTANYDDGRELVGMGIVIHSDATETAKLVLNGTLTQYNFISESKVPTDTYAKNLHTVMFGDSCSKYHFGTSPNRYVNAGIISLTAVFNAEDITDNANIVYVGTKVTVSGVDGYVYTQPNTSGSVNNSYDKNNDPHVATTQGAVAPSYSFDYTNKNYQAKQEGSNDYCYEENGKVNISMDEGDTFNWDTSILTIGKGITIYFVSMNGVDYTGKSIAFNTAGDYEVIYTYTDDNNYKLDENGNITTYSVTYTKTVNISVAVIEAATKHAEFTFGSSNTASTTVTVGNNTYVMPNVSGTSSTIGSTTVSGQTIYYPIVEIVMSDGKTSHTSGWYAYFPVFSGAVTITDYQDNGTGDAETFGSSTQSMPSGLSVVGDPTQLFKYQSSSTAGTSPVVKNNILVYSSPSISAKRSEYNTVIQYSYTDNAGATYYYYVGYHAPAQSYTSCVTPDTLITLADGTQKRIDEVKADDLILVWDFNKGAYTVANASIIENHGYDYNDVVKLVFEDGTTVKVVNVHGFFDADLNKWVDINAKNVQDYIGHSFTKIDGDSYKTVKLVSAEVSTEYVEAWSILTSEYYNCVLEGMFTITPPATLQLAFFEIGEDMKYDAEAMKADIEKYGLYTYDEFDHLMTWEQFEALNMAEMKVAVGKGLITYEEILGLISMYIEK